MKRVLGTILTVLLLTMLFAVSSVILASDTNTPSMDGETSRTTTTLYPGVTNTKIATSSTSKYERQQFNIVQFDLSQTNLYLDVTNESTYANDRKTTLNTVTSFNSSNGDGKKAIAAINGDMWMMTSAHARVQGSGTSYGGYSDAVVTASLTLPRAFNMYDGEIICSSYMETETPYEEEFWAFGITDDYVPLIGCPQLGITINNNTKGTSTTGDGLNRLPANNSLVVYSDKGCLNNYALSDAYEVVIDCTSDYTVAHGSTITGRITGIYSSLTASNPTMQANRIILTARGTALSKLVGYAVGDTVSLSFNVYEKYGRDSDKWQTVTNVCGGHMPFVVDGVKWETGTTVNYPTTIVGIKNDGSVVFVANDGRQSSLSTGLDFNDYWDFADDLDLNTAIILDGGGSTTLVELSGSDYNVVNSPSDGSSRAVVNSIILSYGPSRGAQGDFDVEYPYEGLDIKNLFFGTEEAQDLLTRVGGTAVTNSANGVKLKVEDYNAALGVFATFSYGLPNTSSYNSNSVLAGKTYPSLNAANYPYMVIDLAVNCAASSAVHFQTLYMTAGSQKGIGGNTFIGYNNVFTGGTYNRYTIQMNGNSSWTGKINSIHLGYLLEANGVTISDGDTVTVRAIRFATDATQAATLASQTPTLVRVNFNANGGTVSKSGKYLIHGFKYMRLPTPEKANAEFSGWYTAASGGTLVTDTTMITNPATHTLYAHWKTAANTITYNTNGGTAVSPTTGNGTVTLAAAPTKSGNAFVGWSNDGGATVYPAKSSYNLTGDTTMTAIWTTGCFVFYSPNGGTWGGSDTSLKASPTAYGVLTNNSYYYWPAETATLMRPGYRLHTSEAYMNVPRFYSANGSGTGINTSPSYNNGYGYDLWPYNAESLTNGGHDANYFSQSGLGLAAGTNVVFFACWDPLVIYDMNDGSGRTVQDFVYLTGGNSYTVLNLGGSTRYANNKSATNFENYTGLMTIPSSREGYTFAGWRDINGNSYTVGQTYSVTQPLTLYAQWTPVAPVTYTVSFNANGGTGAPASQTKTHGETLTLTATVPTRDGYTFIGWASSSSATTAEYAAGGSYTDNAAVTLYAVWQQNQTPPVTDTIITSVTNYTVTIDGIDDVNLIRYALGSYTTASQIKAAAGNKSVSKNIASGLQVVLPDGGSYTFYFRHSDGTEEFKTVTVSSMTPVVSVDGIKIRIDNVYGVQRVTAAPGHYTTHKQARDALGARSATYKTVQGKYHEFTIYTEYLGEYTVVVEYTDGTIYFEYITIDIKVPTFSSNGMNLCFGNYEDIQIVRYAPGTYSDVKSLKQAAGAKSIRGTALNPYESYLRYVIEPGVYTAYIQYTNGYSIILTTTVVKTEPVFSVNGSAITVSNLTGLNYMRYVAGTYTTDSAIKAAPGCKLLRAADIGGVDSYTISNLPSGNYSFCVYYTDQSNGIYTVTVG